MYHPLQTLADLMTLKEHFGNIKGKTLAWVKPSLLYFIHLFFYQF